MKADPRPERPQTAKGSGLPVFFPRLNRLCLLAHIVIFSILLIGCDAGWQPVRPVPSILDPHGPAAARIENLWWLLFGLGTAVYLVVMAALLYALFRRRQEREAPDGQDEPRWRRVLLWGGLVLPALILVIVYGFTLSTLRATAIPASAGEIVIEVVGRRWWWEVHYLEQQITSANEIVIPVGRPVHLRLTSDEVIHSFWVPQLHGKMDANPRVYNDFWLQADQAGEYWGECAEYCGVQHARMRFLVIAVAPEAFEAWLDEQALPALRPANGTAVEGEQVFLRAGCIHCHTVRGTNATGELGPDLTHFASRRTLASGTLENTRGSLGGWIADPHSIKPGNLMPPTALSGAELNALIAYLESLR